MGWMPRRVYHHAGDQQQTLPFERRELLLSGSRMPRGNLETCQGTKHRPPDAENGERADSGQQERAMFPEHVIETSGRLGAIGRIPGVGDTRKGPGSVSMMCHKVKLLCWEEDKQQKNAARPSREGEGFGAAFGEGEQD